MLLRHGKSDWDANIARDHDRILAPRGEQAAKLMGQAIRDSDLIPDRIVSSSAIRARSTAELASEAGAWGCPMKITEDLYATSVSGALSVLRSQDEGGSVGRILLVGHEPTWSGLASGLIGGGRLGVVTASLVVITLGIQRWADIGLSQGELSLFVIPRWLKKALD